MIKFTNRLTKDHFIKAIVCCVALGLLTTTASAESKKKTQTAAKPKASPTSSIVRVNVSNQSHSSRMPWQKNDPSGKRGLGAVISGNRILVTAELVSNATYIELEMPSTGAKAPATVEVLDYECDLAVLRPNDPKFLQDMIALEIAEPSKLGDTLEVWQLESNGTGVKTPVKITQVEVGSYFAPGQSFLLYRASGNVQYRAGTFTLPVIHDGKIAGLLLRYSSKDEVSTMLPTQIMHHFISDLKDGHYGGFPTLGVGYTQTLDDQLRAYLKLDEASGVFVSSTSPGASAAAGGIKAGDVILKIDGQKIDSRGNYNHPSYGLVNMSHIVRSRHVGETIDVDILRDGKKKTVKVPLKRKAPEDYVVDPYIYDRGHKYLIMGGLLFQELSRPYLESYGKEWETRAPFRLRYAMNHPEAYEEDGRRKIVFLAGVLPSVSVQGYERLGGLIIDSVNGQKIGDINELDLAFNKPKDGLHEIRFTDFPKVIWLDDELAKQDNFLFIPQRYRIQNRMRLE